MKKIVKVLLIIVMAFCAVFALAACNDTNPCKDGHAWDNGTVTKQANCVEKGEMTVKCTNCDETKTVEIAIDSANHKGPEAAIDPVAPSCTTPGSKGGKICSACEAVIVQPVEDPATGHNFDATTHVCTCGEIDPEYPVKVVVGEQTTYVKTIVEAVASAEANKEMTVTLLNDITDGGLFIAEGKNIKLTIDLDTHTYTVGDPLVGSTGTVSQNLHFETGNTVTFKNGTIVSAEGTKAQMLIQNYCNLTLDGIVLDGRNLAGIAPYTLSNNFGAVAIKGNSNIVAKENAVAFDLYYGMFEQYDNGLSVSVEAGSTINGKIEYGAASRIAGNEWTAKAALSLPKGGYNIVYTSTLACGDANIKIDGVKITHSFVENVCSACGKELSESEVLDTLFALKKSGDIAPGTYKLTGLVTTAKFFNETYKSIELTIEVAGKTVTCYGLIGSEECPLDADTIKLGQTITVIGSFKYIYGKYEFDAGCQLQKIEYAKVNVNVSINNGTTSLPATVTNNDTVEFTVTPDAGYRVDEVKVYGKIIEPVDGKYTFVVLGEVKAVIVTVPESEKIASEIVNFDFSNSELKNEDNKIQAYYKEWSVQLGDYNMTINNFNNNNWGWDFIRAGHKEYEDKGAMKTTLTESVSKIVVTVDNVDNRYMGDVTLVVKNSSGEVIETIVIEAKDVVAGHLTFRVSQPTANCTYELEFDTSKTGSATNGFLQVSSVVFYGYAED